MRFSDRVRRSLGLKVRLRRAPYDEPRPPYSAFRRKRDLDDGGVPVEPDGPKTFSGGAAATLEIDE